MVVRSNVELYGFFIAIRVGYVLPPTTRTYPTFSNVIY